MSIDTTAEAEGKAISKSNGYRTKHPRHTRASLKEVPSHMRVTRKKISIEPEPLISKNKMSKELRALLNAR